LFPQAKGKVMPRVARGLTAVRVRTAQPGRYGDGGGLYLLVRSPERRYWLFRYTPPGGKMREMGLGPASGRTAVSLAEARARAAELFRLTRAGVDPLEQRAAGSAAPAHSFREVAALYIDAHEASWRNATHRQQWRNTLDTYADPLIGHLPVEAIDTGQVMAVLDPIWRTRTETAARPRGRIEAVLDYAKAHGWRSGDNPARWRGHIAQLLPARARIAAVKHHAALPWREMAAFMVDLSKLDGVAPLALCFTILTAARSGEVLHARWPEIDMAEGVWTVPGGRMKAGREHRVPLSNAAQDVLHSLLLLRDVRRADFVFPGVQTDRPLSRAAMERVLSRRIGRGDLTVHGFRSTFRDWCAEATNCPREVAEAALAHALQDRTEAAYRRGDLFDKRRQLMEDWSAWCSRTPAADEVVPIRS
jgi:integrase